jgi:hypothetical protein
VIGISGRSLSLTRGNQIPIVAQVLCLARVYGAGGREEAGTGGDQRSAAAAAARIGLTGAAKLRCARRDPDLR